MAQETRQFQAEVREILDLMIHSLYSHREVFLRELISNASDALDKLRFAEVQNPELAAQSQSSEKQIRLSADVTARTLTISDNGIGMTHDEVLKYLGTIAHSGTKEFIKQANAAKERPELIGQFGVGFYSAFMVADRVTVSTCKAGSDVGVLWSSTGDGTFTIDTQLRPEGHGTTITLHLRTFESEENAQDFTDAHCLRSVVKKHSDFIAWPIVLGDETLNSRKALWLRSPSEVTDEEYKEFYSHVAHDWAEPLERIHYKAEGSQEFAALLYVPGIVPMDYNYRETKWGLSLYINRVFIMEHCQDLLPSYLRFMRGVIDSSDLSLNVSREMLQKDRQVQAIRKGVASKVIKHLQTMLAERRDNYEKLWHNFGSTLKEGMAPDSGNKDKVTDLLLFHSSAGDKLTTLAEYVLRMPVDQKDIYFITGDSLALVMSSPYLERLRQKGFEVLYCVDKIDEWMMQMLQEYSGKSVTSITQEGLELDSESEKEFKSGELKAKEEEFRALMQTMQAAVDAHVKEVRLSSRLVDSPVCLVSGEHEMSAQMERLMASMGHAVPKTKRIMEINPDHPLFATMKQLPEETQKEWAEILYNQALLIQGSPIEDPTKFSKQIARLMTTNQGHTTHS